MKNNFHSKTQQVCEIRFLLLILYMRQKCKPICKDLSFDTNSVYHKVILFPIQDEVTALSGFLFFDSDPSALLCCVIINKKRKQSYRSISASTTSSYSLSTKVSRSWWLEHVFMPWPPDGIWQLDTESCSPLMEDTLGYLILTHLKHYRGYGPLILSS